MSPRRYQISVRGETYDRVKARAEANGIPVTELAEIILGDPVPVAPVEPRTFTCAICANGVTCAPVTVPYGRDGADVNICTACSDEHPRAGRYSFDHLGQTDPGGIGDGNSRASRPIPGTGRRG